MKDSAIWVVKIDPPNGKYMPKLCEITIQSIKDYADRIGCELNVIEKRMYPDWPITYEKMQVYHLGKDYTHNLLMDIDLIVREDFPDFRHTVPINIVGLLTSFDADKFYKPDMYFLRDGRKIGVSATIVRSSYMTHDIWTPLDISKEEAIASVKNPYNVDEYCLSRNLSRFGLKIAGLCSDQSMIFHLDATTASIDKTIRTNNSEDTLVDLATAKIKEWKDERT